jgi:ubiquinone/menaquinone biosynthesis C-methylase UbiE
MSALLITDELLVKLISRLVCPHSGQPLGVLAPQALEALNADIAQGAVFSLSHVQWATPLDMALVNAAGTFYYPVLGGIFCFLDDYALQKGKQQATNETQAETQALQNSVRAFYDSVGWEENQDEHYVDAQLYEDTRPVVADYLTRSHRRVARYLAPEGGTFILDAASGPVQYPEYLAYHANFEWRICLDFSVQALRQAQKKLGAKGVYIMVDLTCLPFAAGSMDAVVSLHTIYHIPAALQRQAFLEIYRVLAPGKSAVVVYGWGNYSRIKQLGILHLQIAWAFKTLMRRLKPQTSSTSGFADFYVHFHNWEWFESQKWPFKLKLFQWRTLDPMVTKIWIQPFLCGKQILTWLADVEDIYPEELALSGSFPAFVIEKSVAAPASE